MWCGAGTQASDINVAQGHKQSTVLAAEAAKLDAINRAEGAFLLAVWCRQQWQRLRPFVARLREGPVHGLTWRLSVAGCGWNAAGEAQATLEIATKTAESIRALAAAIRAPVRTTQPIYVRM